MNKKLLAIMIAATLLQGCTSFRQAENTRKTPLLNNNGPGK